MPSHRKPRLFTTRKRARAVTLCAATLSAAALPTLAQAATGGSGSAKPATPAAAHPVVHAALAASSANATQGHFEAVSDGTTSSSSSSSSYTVVSGDTLSGIAQRFLGDGDDYHQLFKLNKDHVESDGRTFTDANLIYPGWNIQLPSGTSDSASSSSDDSSSSDSSSAGSGSSASSSNYSSSSSNSGSSASSSSASSSDSSSASSSTSYADDLDGWINQAISILSANGYTVSYNAIYQTAMNESSGNPDAENDWDSNAAEGNPSIGLMQTTQTTFDAYALPGYTDIYNPVDNIIAAAIYAQDTYGGLDVVVADRCGGSCWSGY
jgi:Transglycosylase SLT domain/LysM domain